MHIHKDSPKYGLISFTVDDEDYELLSQYSLFLHMCKGIPTLYAKVYKCKKSTLCATRIIMGLPPFNIDSRRVVHLDQDYTNLRKSNLKIVDPILFRKHVEHLIPSTTPQKGRTKKGEICASCLKCRSLMTKQKSENRVRCYNCKSTIVAVYCPRHLKSRHFKGMF